MHTSPLAPEASELVPRHERALSLVVLGADVLISARPATAVQLAHACHALGFHGVVPASWADELLAGACLDLLEECEQRCAVFCACPRVAHRLLASGSDLGPAMISLVSPPVAVARYLRALYAPSRVRITWVGACHGAGNELLDARLMPQELFETFLDRGIVISDQPTSFDDVLPPDRRRYLSLPGGAPSGDMLAARLGGALREVGEREFALELTQLLLDGGTQLLDPAPHLACSCAGVVPGLTNGDARDQLMGLEPPRAGGPVVDPRILGSLELRLPVASRAPADLAIPAVASGGEGEPALQEGDPTRHAAAPLLLAASSGAPRHSPMRGISMIPALPAEDPRDLSPIPRRRSPAQGILRPPLDSLPIARDPAGRLLPRAYVARRRAGPWRQHPVTPELPEPPEEPRD